MHRMIPERIDNYRSKCSDADVQGHRSDLDFVVDQATDQWFSKVQTGRRSRDRSRVLGKNRLIVLDIGVDHLAATNVVR